MPKIPGVETLSPEQVARIMDQMRTNGRTFWDSWADWADGEQVIYRYDGKAGEYVRERTDVIVGAYALREPMSPETLAETLAKFSLHGFREQGFDV